MSTIEPIETTAEPWDNQHAASVRNYALPAPTPIVPSGSIAGRSLTAVVAIMTFLAVITTGAVTDRGQIARTIGSPMSAARSPFRSGSIAGRNIETDVRTAVGIAGSTAGIADVRAYTKEESQALVEPWLGSGLALGDLPIPRMIVVKLQPGAAPDLRALRSALTAQVPSAILDDHRGWIDRMRTMADAAVIGGLAILALVVAATVLSVTFATRGTMAANRPIVEVLHYVGAKDSFVAGQFQRHFLLLGLKGGAIGGGAAILLFVVLGIANAWIAGTPGGDEAAALFGVSSIGIGSYLAIFGQIVLMAAVTALTSRRTVNHTLENHRISAGNKFNLPPKSRL